MSLYDCFFDSIQGLHRAEALLEQAARVIADPSKWASPSYELPSQSFSNALVTSIGQQGRGDENKGGGVPPPVPGAGPPGRLDGLGVGQNQGPLTLLDAMIAAMVAQRMYEANARMIAIENRIVGIIIHLGEENYRSDS